MIQYRTFVQLANLSNVADRSDETVTGTIPLQLLIS